MLEAVSEALAGEVAPLGLRVLIVEPGMFRTNLLGAGYRAMPAMPAYAASVGGLRAYVDAQRGAQIGDPVRAARAIVDAVEAGSPTLRLPLGVDAVQQIRGKLAQLAADVDRNEKVAVATGYVGPA